MPMLKQLASAVDMTTTGAIAAVKLGDTPFFPGGNAIIRLTSAIGGSGVITVQGSPTQNGTFTNIRTINAAAGTDVEVTDLPPWIRLNKTTVGTGTIANIYIEGVQ